MNTQAFSLGIDLERTDILSNEICTAFDSLTVTVRDIGAKYAQIWTWMESHVL